ncbi:ALK and LTK ligand 2b isoform X1 [Ictalurus furcatus]|uniref:ALK and LTK ligand 2b isoform X1 n=1 Tax=Ictalurus furcatus TaxID=66913 RepID=UPI002350B2C1|nr:ALK and LTK ligand 2b isoform X1 [Ictalurus furcatus]
MSVLRAPVITALALLIVSGGYGGQSGSASARSTSLLQLLAASGREAAEHQASSPLPIKTDYSIESREGNEVNKSNQHDQILDVFPRDLRQKEKFLKHLTGEQQSNIQHKHVYCCLCSVSMHLIGICVASMSLTLFWVFLFISGPLYFSPKCSKHFYRLYHNTRDCTIPACKCYHPT